MADAIDAHMAGMGEPYGYLWQEKSSPKTEWKFTKESPDAEDRKWNHIIPLYTAPPIDIAAVRKVIAELNGYCEASDGSCYGTLSTSLVLSYMDKLEAAMPKELR